MAAVTYEEEQFLTRMGYRIGCARRRRDMTQAELARRIGMTRPSVSNIEAGRQDFTMTTLAAIAGVLRLNLGDLA